MITCRCPSYTNICVCMCIHYMYICVYVCMFVCDMPWRKPIVAVISPKYWSPSICLLFLKGRLTNTLFVSSVCVATAMPASDQSSHPVPEPPGCVIICAWCMYVVLYHYQLCMKCERFGCLNWLPVLSILCVIFHVFNMISEQLDLNE